MMKILRTILWKNALNWSAWFSGFSSFRQLTLDMGVFNRFMGSPDCKDFKNAMEGVIFEVPDSTLFLVKKCQKLIGLILRIFIISTTNPWHGGVYKVHGMSRLQGYRNCYGGSLFSRHLVQPSFWGVWGVFRGVDDLKKAEMDKT